MFHFKLVISSDDDVCPLSFHLLLWCNYSSLSLDAGCVCKKSEVSPSVQWPLVWFGRREEGSIHTELTLIDVYGSLGALPSFHPSSLLSRRASVAAIHLFREHTSLGEHSS